MAASYLVFFVMIHFCWSIYLPKPSTHQPELIQAEPKCPYDCSCNFDLSYAICQNGFSLSLINDKFHMYQLRALSIKRVEDVLYVVDFDKFTKLENLDLRGNVISEVPDKSFHGLTVLKSLNLNSNYIHGLNKTVFKGLHSLQKLDISHNVLHTIEEELLDDLENLEVLNLSMNAIVTLPLGAFKNLRKLRVLDLTANELVQLTLPMFDGLVQLQVLNISHNNLVTVSETLAYFSDRLSEFIVSKNNFDCSCELVPLIDRIKSDPFKYGDPSEFICNGRFKLQQLENVTMPCELPKVYYISNSTSIMPHNSVLLQCESFGVPMSIHYWHTPWGENFAHVHVKDILKSYNISTISHSSYAGYSLGLVSEISIKEDGALYINGMRGYFAGDYVCVALNGIGSSNYSVHLGIHTPIDGEVYTMAMVHGAGCMFLSLLVGIVIGLISLCVQKCSCCKCCSCCSCAEATKPEFKFTIEEIIDREDNNKHSTLESCNSNDSYYSLEPPGTPFNSPLDQTPRASPLKCPTPNMENGDRSKVSPNIKDTLDEVKVRLEKKMEKVRGHYHSIKETGSVYLSTIKGSAATKVASGMEQVKFGVRSIKEFCGTGDMGTQTISALSFGPDVDMATQTDDTCMKSESTTL